MKKTIIVVALLLGVGLLTGCNKGKDKVKPNEGRPDEVWPDGTKVFGKRTLQDGTKKALRVELPDGTKKFEET